MVAQTLNETTGLVLGKFYPPTLGHQYIVDFARNYVQHLTVIVGSLEREEIPGELRVRWVREMFPGVEIGHLTDENPQYPHEHTHFWEIWEASIRKLMPVGPDFVFASEEYGFKLAEVLGAIFVPVDAARQLVPVCATAVREDPMANWDFIPACVRPWFVRRVCIIGPESTGKTVLAERLARHYGTVFVAEYARGCIDAHGGAVKSELFEMFVRGQASSETALARQANRLLICDSDAFTTGLYHELYAGGVPDYIMAEARGRSYDLYLLTYHDTPYVEEVQRNHPGQRDWFFSRCVAWLEERSAEYVVLRGEWDARFDQARKAVDALLHAKHRPRPDAQRSSDSLRDG